MVYQLRLGGKSDEAVEAILKREFTGIRYQIASYAFIQFIFSKIKWSIFQEIHEYVINFQSNAQKALYHSWIVHNSSI